MEKFCTFLDKGAEDKRYLQYKEIPGITLSLEGIDEGNRNLNIIDDRLYLVFNIQHKHLAALAAHVRSYTKADSSQAI